MKERDFVCKHIEEQENESVFIYNLINRDLCLCEKCEALLRKQILEQDKIEKEIAPEIVKFSEALGDNNDINDKR